MFRFRYHCVSGVRSGHSWQNRAACSRFCRQCDKYCQWARWNSASSCGHAKLQFWDILSCEFWNCIKGEKSALKSVRDYKNVLLCWVICVFFYSSEAFHAGRSCCRQYHRSYSCVHCSCFCSCSSNQCRLSQWVTNFSIPCRLFKDLKAASISYHSVHILLSTKVWLSLSFQLRRINLQFLW